LLLKSTISISSCSLMKYASAAGSILFGHILLRQKVRCLRQWTRMKTTSSSLYGGEIRYRLTYICCSQSRKPCWNFHTRSVPDGTTAVIQQSYSY
jgi:hypothetical protein